MIRHRYNLNGEGDARRGFTLIELLVVIVIIGVLTAIAVPIYLNQRVASWKATVVSDVHNAAKQVELASYHGDGSLTQLSAYHDARAAADDTVLSDVRNTATQVELASYHGDGSLTQLSDYRVKPAADTASGSPTIIADKTFVNADGKYDGRDTIGSEPVPVSPGNTTEIEVKSDNSYTIYGANTNVHDWVYRYDSARGAGEWENGSYPSADPDDDCLVVLDGTKLIIGADGTRCKLSTAMVDSKVGPAYSDAGTRDEVTEIDLHGHVVIVDGSDLFASMPSLTSIPYLDGQSVTSSVNGVSYQEMFRDDANLANADSISHWDTSNVTSMSYMFFDAYAFNQPVSNFNTSKVTDMSGIFYGARAFNQPVSNFDTGKVTNMSDMFAFASVFNQFISNFDTSNVTNMNGMFLAASSFNQPVPFDTRNVTDMSGMFASANAFNQSVSNFDTSKVTDMSLMFYDAQAFNQPVSNFDTSKVTDMSYVFEGASSFNQPISNFITSKVTNMNSMFWRASSFNQPVSNFDTSKVTDMSFMFAGASSFNQSVSNFDTSNVTNMSRMFHDASSFNQPISNFDTSNVMWMDSMFQGATAFDQDLTGWNVGSVTNHYGFNDYSALTAGHLPKFKS